MKHLRVEYSTDGGQPVVLFDGDVDEISWSDGANGVSVSGKMRRQGGARGPSLMDVLASASNKKQSEERTVEANHSPPVDVSSA